MSSAASTRPGTGRPIDAPDLMLIRRPALLAALDRAVATKVTVIAAPPGSGKSSLLRSWAARDGLGARSALVTVPRGERDPQRFWLTVLDAIVDDPAGRASVATPEFDGRGAVGRVLSAVATLDAPVVLAIDDLHELESELAMSLLDELIDRMPATLHLVLSSRRDPPLRLHRLRLEGELAEIRAADLRFSDRETAELLQRSGITLDGGELAALQERTEGWAAGLQLAAIAMAGRAAPGAFVYTFSGSDRTVAEYLVAEVLERQPDHVRRLLLRTSIADRLNGPLADLLTGSSGSHEILVGLEDANAFVVSLDPERTWFRYHHLLGDLLRLELLRRWPEDVAMLHHSASEWYEQQGLVVEAIRHALAAGAWDRAAALLFDGALGLVLDGAGAIVHELLLALPGSSREQPELLVVLAADELERGALEEARHCLALAEQRAGLVTSHRRHRFDVTLAATRMLIARRRGEFAGVLREVDRLDGASEPRTYAEVELGSDLRAFALFNLGIVNTWCLRLDDAREQLEQAAEIANRIGRPYLEVGCRAHLGFVAMDEGLEGGRGHCTDAIRLAERFGWGEDAVVVPALAALGGMLTFAGEYTNAEDVLGRAEAIRRRDRIDPATGLLLHLSQGMLFAGRRAFSEAIREFRAGERMQGLLATQHALAAQMRSFRISMELRLGKVEEARAALDAIEPDGPYWGESLVATADVRLAEGQPQDALDALERVLDGTAPVIRRFAIVQAHVLAARAWASLGDRQQSEAAVERALHVAEPERTVLPFSIADGAELLERHPRHRTAHASLLTDVIDVLRGGAGPIAPTEDLATPLSPGELRVLGHLPSNLSAAEIAADLIVSVNTVKTHMRRIYAKLDAHTRSAAVSRARELGLLARRR